MDELAAAVKASRDKKRKKRERKRQKAELDSAGAGGGSDTAANGGAGDSGTVNGRGSKIGKKSKSKKLKRQRTKAPVDDTPPTAAAASAGDDLDDIFSDLSKRKAEKVKAKAAEAKQRAKEIVRTTMSALRPHCTLSYVVVSTQEKKRALKAAIKQAEQEDAGAMKPGACCLWRCRDPQCVAHRLTTGAVRYDDDGLPIYTEEQLNINKGGNTALCPFDCDCCF